MYFVFSFHFSTVMALQQIPSYPFGFVLEASVLYGFLFYKCKHTKTGSHSVLWGKPETQITPKDHIL